MMEQRLTPRQKGQVYLGLGVGLSCMVISSGLVLALLFVRNKLLRWRKHRPTHVSSRARSYTNSYSYSASGSYEYDDQSLDMTRSMAFNRRSFRSPLSNGTPGSSLSDGIYGPPLRPLHSYHDPFAHRDRIRRDLLEDMNPRPRAGFPNSEPGAIAIVPFRESNLPIADAFYTDDGRVHRPADRGRDVMSTRHGNSRRGPRLFRQNRREEATSVSESISDLGRFDGRNPREWRHSHRDAVVEWERNHYNRDRFIPEDDDEAGLPVDIARRSPADFHAPIHNINFSRVRHNHVRFQGLPRIHVIGRMCKVRDSSHLQDVYY